jgi:hypothetical protein
MKIHIMMSSGKLGEETIVDFERSLGITLPNSYRSFLLKHNGGMPEPNYFPLLNNPIDKFAIVNYLYCISSGDDYDIRNIIISMEGRLPRDLLPIGEDPGGNLICIAVSGSNFGKVYFWDHEDELPLRQPSDYHNVYFLSNDFLQFFDSITDLPMS